MCMLWRRLVEFEEFRRREFMIQKWDTIGVMEVGLELVNARYRNKSLEIYGSVLYINKSSARRASFSLLSSGGLEVTLWVVDQSG